MVDWIVMDLMEDRMGWYCSTVLGRFDVWIVSEKKLQHRSCIRIEMRTTECVLLTSGAKLIYLHSTVGFQNFRESPPPRILYILDLCRIRLYLE